MTKYHLPIAVLTLSCTLAACANSSNVFKNLTTPPQTADADKPTAKPKRGTPVVAGRPARLYVMAGFREKDCSPIEADVKLQTAPRKGTVTFKPKQQTVVQFSASGKCIGQTIVGTGIYYTAKKGQVGADSFSIVATAGRSKPSTKTFNVNIAE